MLSRSGSASPREEDLVQTSSEVPMFMSRRMILKYLPFAGSYVCRFGLPIRALTSTSVRIDDLKCYLDTAAPEKHCTEKHDHTDNTFDDWRGVLAWSDANCGYNEGAAAVVAVAVEYGLSYPDLMLGCIETENLIPRVDRALKDPAYLKSELSRVPPRYLSPEDASKIEQAVSDGKSFTEILLMAPPPAAGHVWRRKAMLRFARTLVRKGKVVQATAIASSSQWHNCVAFRCLLRHSDDVVVWLSQ